MSRTLVNELYTQLSLPIISSPMFIVSDPKLVLAQCASGIVGSMPALNARPQSQLAEWLKQITNGLAALKQQYPDKKIAPYAINHIIHASNTRLQQDLDTCAEFKVPLVITSLRAPNDVVNAIHAWGGKVFHDVTTLRHAQKALDAGVDGLILVCSGAGGHAGTLSPFALLAEVRKIYDGPVALSGAISRGQDILAAQAMGADFAYMGTRFIASTEANAQADYKQMLVDAQASDIIYTPYFSGIPANFLKSSIAAAGLDPDQLPQHKSGAADFGNEDSKVWRDIWSAGQGVGNITQIQPVAEIIEALQQEYLQASQALNQRIKPHISSSQTA